MTGESRNWLRQARAAHERHAGFIRRLGIYVCRGAKDAQAESDVMRLKRYMLAAEAAVWLTAAGLGLRLLPFRRLAPLLGSLHSPVPDDDGGRAPTAAERALAQRVGAVVPRVAKLLPWPVLCLPQAMAAKAMLARRGIASTMHLGAMPTENASGIAAHAWLSVGPMVVTGAAARPGHAELGRFG